jgi:23S rRNA (cytidine1920-2'-O)/16S rRNA (cytidine1409-2'-O)-methyltransferase
VVQAPRKQRLDVLLVERGLCPTRERARARILAGDAIVGDHRVDKPGTAVPMDAPVRLRGEEMPWVSRGGLKLAHALDVFAIPVRDRVALDVGASTGGFTHVLLSAGARLVFAVDVGVGQLADALRKDPRVRVMERTHVKDLTTLEPVPDFCCIDVSFISLRLVLPHVARMLHRGGDVVALIKPQFEVGKGQVGSGGIVRDVPARQAAVERVRTEALSMGFQGGATIESPVTGQKGNVEFLAHWTLPPQPL